VLPRLARDGLAEQRRVVQTTRPDKLLYRISPAGREALTRWLETPEPGAVDAFYLRLFVGRLTSVDVLQEHVEQFRRDTEERLEELRAIEPTNTRTGHDFFHHFMLRFGIERYEQELAWSRWVLEELDRA
jgi:PadR family transcriptional regulator AphA